LQDKQLFRLGKELLTRFFSVLQKERRFLANLVFQRKDIQNTLGQFLVFRFLLDFCLLYFTLLSDNASGVVFVKPGNQ
jgi:hypothetical protein